MQVSDTAALLALCSAYDNRNVTEETATAWKAALDLEIPDLTPDVARQVIVNHFATSDEYFTVGHLIRGAKQALRRTPREMRADWRAAKARGIVEQIPERLQPLPAKAALKLAEARAMDEKDTPELEPARTWQNYGLGFRRIGQ